GRRHRRQHGLAHGLYARRPCSRNSRPPGHRGQAPARSSHRGRRAHLRCSLPASGHVPGRAGGRGHAPRVRAARLGVRPARRPCDRGRRGAARASPPRRYARRPRVLVSRTLSQMGERTRKQVAAWLLVLCALLFVMIVVGGITRLTRSGLSIVEWQPIVGTLPPLNEAQWNELFEKYKLTPEYEQVNFGMSLEDFKRIFWWEYI